MDEALQSITHDLGQHRDDAVLIEQSRRLRSSLHPHLLAYGDAGLRVLQWAEDSILAACRRLLDDRTSTRSLVRTLRAVSKEAGAEGVTAERLAAHWATSGRQFDAPLRDVASGVLSEIAGQPTGRLPRKAPTRDLEELRRAHAEVVQAASSSVAHDDPSASFVLSVARVDAVVEDVMRLALRWSRLIDGVQTRSIGEPQLGGLVPMTHALRLFDWTEYVDARAEASRRGLSRVSADDSAQLEYRFTD